MFLQNIFTPVYPIKIGSTQILGDEIHNPDIGKRVTFAVNMKHCYKTYGICRGKHIALDDFSMEVPVGEIFCLFGVEGKGKSAAINVLMDRTRVDEGFVKVLGYSPGHSKIRNKIGYMSQRTSLPLQLTVKEIFLFYGKLGGFDEEEIMNRYRFLNPFFELPRGDTLVQDLSVGEKKIVSFVVSVIHDPELLILDEPTTDMDVMATHSVRRYIRRIVKLNKRTVIYTARFVEDTKLCTIIGLVGAGFMIEQGLVEDLLAKYNTEHVFQLQKKVVSELRGAQEQEIREGATKELSASKSERRSSKVFSSKKNRSRKVMLKLKKWKKLYLSTDYKCMSCAMFLALIHMCLKRIVRNVALLIILVMFPILQAIVFGYAFNSKLKGMIVATANNDAKLKEDKYASCKKGGEGCDAEKFSCWLLDDRTTLSTGLQSSMIFYMAILWSCTLLIHEKNSGLFNRFCCSGVYPSQMLIVHYVVLSVIMALQSVVLFALLTYVFGMPDGGHFILIVLIGSLIACSGISCGVLMSCLCSTSRMASIIIMGSFYPVTIVSGILWPLECSPTWFRILSLFSPLTQPTAALRAIRARKRDLGYAVVQNGLITLLVWIIMCYLISLIFIKRNRG